MRFRKRELGATISSPWDVALILEMFYAKQVHVVITCLAGIPAPRDVGIVGPQRIKVVPSSRSIQFALRFAVGPIPPAAMLATKNVMREATALLATNRVPLNVLIAGAPNPAQHRVPRAPSPVNGAVLIKRKHACSRALHPAAWSLAQDDVKRCWSVGINARRYVQVDMILFELIQSLCCRASIFFTTSTLDGHLRLSSCYELDEQGLPLRAKPFSIDPASQAPLTGCPSCRGSLRSINRYKRPIKKAVLDESTQKVLWGAHAEYTALCDAVQTFETNLNLNVESNQTSLDEIIWRATLHPDVVKLGKRLEAHQESCMEAEQPYGKTRSLIVDAVRRRNIPESFHVDETVIQTTCSLRARSLTLQFHQVCVAGLREISLKPTATPLRLTQIGEELAYLTVKYAQQSRGLVQAAKEAMSHVIETEARLFWAHFELLALKYPHSSTQTEDRERQWLATYAVQKSSLKSCLARCDQNRAEKLLRELNGSEPFYSRVTDEERQAVYNAMEVKFRGAGHWYRCENGHPFTVGECGLPMELAKCPECGAQVGGQRHQPVAGVTRDVRMDTGFRQNQRRNRRI
ncbi:hypothetical protein DFS34DRAFT_593977 [Phlyctochytrium arcticum]|nr:hypothetical protein DFS34DRAFT_593977 [Phlyctochytrium arcticum]